MIFHLRSTSDAYDTQWVVCLQFHYILRIQRFSISEKLALWFHEHDQMAAYVVPWTDMWPCMHTSTRTQAHSRLRARTHTPKICICPPLEISFHILWTSCSIFNLLKINMQNFLQPIHIWKFSSVTDTISIFLQRYSLQSQHFGSCFVFSYMRLSFPSCQLSSTIDQRQLQKDQRQFLLTSLLLASKSKTLKFVSWLYDCS